MLSFPGEDRFIPCRIGRKPEKSMRKSAQTLDNYVQDGL
jgi:hypothetical protein